MQQVTKNRSFPTESPPKPIVPQVVTVNDLVPAVASGQLMHQRELVRPATVEFHGLLGVYQVDRFLNSVVRL